METKLPCSAPAVDSEPSLERRGIRTGHRGQEWSRAGFRWCVVPEKWVAAQEAVSMIFPWALWEGRHFCRLGGGEQEQGGSSRVRTRSSATPVSRCSPVVEAAAQS